MSESVGSVPLCGAGSLRGFIGAAGPANKQ